MVKDTTEFVKTTRERISYLDNLIALRTFSLGELTKVLGVQEEKLRQLIRIRARIVRQLEAHTKKRVRREQ